MIQGSGKSIACTFLGLMAGICLAAVARTRAAPLHQAIGIPSTQVIPDVIRARQFEVVDREGKSRILLAISEDGAARIVLQDPNGRSGAMLGVDTEGRTTLEMRDANQKQRVVLTSSEDKGTLLALADADGQPNVVVAALADGSQAIRLLNFKSNKSGLSLLVSPDGKSEIVSVDKSGKKHALKP